MRSGHDLTRLLDKHSVCWRILADMKIGIVVVMKTGANIDKSAIRTGVQRFM